MNSPTHQLTNSPTPILIVEDDPFLAENLLAVVEEAGYTGQIARDGREGLTCLSDQSYGLMLLDLELPRVHGMDVLRQAVKDYPTMPIVIVSGEGTIPMALEATRLGAFDYLEKPVDMDRILLTVKNALEKSRLQRERDALLKEAGERYRLVGDSVSMQQTLRVIEKIAAVPSWVLITGAQGTGKELAARAIHYRSDRATAPFIAVNCAAIPDTLIESELFGHKKGSFTSATEDRAGKFEQAHGGTLFLDEIGDMSLNAQAKVLRVLSESVIERIGDSKSIPVDVRVLAATNKDIPGEIDAGRFRSDLYYRINVVTLHMPPLQEHLEDISDLAAYFMALLSDRNTSWGAKLLTDNAIERLKKHPWPGNIRELRNTIERLAVMSDSDHIEAHDVEQALSGTGSGRIEDLPALYDARKQFDRRHILKALSANHGKIQETAAALGIDRTYLWKLMQRYKLEADQS